MSIVYAESHEPFTGRPTPYHEQKATEHYIKHYGNLLFLTAVCNSPKSPQERIQAQKEIVICERKLQHWQRHPNYDQARALAEVTKLKQGWRM